MENLSRVCKLAEEPLRDVLELRYMSVIPEARHGIQTSAAKAGFRKHAGRARPGGWFWRG